MGIMSIPCCDIVVKPPAPRIPGGPILVRAGWYHFLVLSNTGFVSTFIASPPLEAIENPSIESPAFSCYAATTANIGITYNNGVLGRGAYIIGETGITLESIDGVTLALRGKSVLVKNQTLETENGIYQINTIGSSTTPWKMIRDSRFPDQRFDDQTIGITDGDINAKLGYYVKDYDHVNGICFGVDAINFSLIKNDYWTEPFARNSWKQDNDNLRYPLAETGMRDDTSKSTHQGLDNWQCADCTRNVESFGISGPTACFDLSVINIETYGTIYMAFPGTPCFSMVSHIFKGEVGEYVFDQSWPQYARTGSSPFKTPSCAGKCAYHNAYTDTWDDFQSRVYSCGTTDCGSFNGTARRIETDPLKQSNVMGQVQPFLDMNGQCNELGVTLYYDTEKKDKDGDEIILSSFETPNNLARIAPPGHPLETPVSVNTRPIVDIECGAYHNIVRFNDNTIMAWGLNSMGQVNVPESLLPDWLRPTGVSKHPKINKICSIHAGFSTSAVLFNDGTVLCWGDPEVADKVNTWKHIRTSPIKILDGSQSQCIGAPSSGFPVCLPGENCAQAENWVPANKYENGSWNANHDWDQEWKSHKSKSPAHPHFDLGTETKYVYPVNYNHVILTDDLNPEHFLNPPDIDVDTNSVAGSDFQDTHPQYSYRYAQKWPSYRDDNGNPISRCAAKGKIKKDFAVAMLRTGQIITTRTEEAPEGKVGLCRDCDNDGKLQSKDLMGVYSSQGPSINEGCRDDDDLSDICKQFGSCPCPNRPECDSSTRWVVEQNSITKAAVPDPYKFLCQISVRPEGIGCFGSDENEGNYNPNWAVFNDPWKSAGHAKGKAEGGLNPVWNKAEANVGWASLPMPQVRFSVPLQNIKPECKTSRTYFNKCSSWFGMNDPCYSECHSTAVNGNAQGTPGGFGGDQQLGSYGYFDMPEHMMSFGCVAGTNAVTWHKSAVNASSGIMNFIQSEIFNDFSGVINGDHTVQSGLKMSQLFFTTSRGGPCGVCRFNGSNILHFPFDNLCSISTGVIFNWPATDGDHASNPLSNFCGIRGGLQQNNGVGSSVYKVSRPWGPVQLSTVVGFLPFPRNLDSFIWDFGPNPEAELAPHLITSTLDNSYQPAANKGQLVVKPRSRNNPLHFIIEPQWFRTFDYVMNEPAYGTPDQDIKQEGLIWKWSPTYSSFDATACDCSSLCWGSDGENLGNDILADGLGCMSGGEIDDKPLCDGAYQFNCYSEPPLKYDPKGSILQKPGQGYTLYGPRFDVDNINNEKNSSVILNEFSLDLDGTKIITISETINNIFYINIWENKKPDIVKPKKLLQRHKIDIATISDRDVPNRFQENVSQLKVINNNEILLQLTSTGTAGRNENLFIVVSGIYTETITTKIIKFLTARSSLLAPLPLGKSTFDINEPGCYSEDSHDGDFGSNPLILKSQDSGTNTHPVISFSLRTPESKFRIAVIQTIPNYGSASTPGTIKVYEECSSALTPNFNSADFILKNNGTFTTADTNKYIYFISIAKIKNEDISNTARYSQLNKVFDKAQFPGPTLGIKIFQADIVNQTVEDENLASAGGETIDHLLISDDGTTLIAGLHYTRTLAFWKFSSDVSFPINRIFLDNTFEIIYTNLKLNDNNYAQICSIKFESNIFVKVDTEGVISTDSPLWERSTASYGVNYWANLVQFNTDNSIAALWGYSNDYKGDGSEEHSRPDLRSSCSNHANVVERYNLTYGATAGYITNTIQSTQNKKIFIWKGSFFNYRNGWYDTFAHEKHTIRFNKSLTHLAVISHNNVTCATNNENIFEPKGNLLYVDIENNKYKLITSDVFYGLRGAELSSVCINPKNPNLVLLSNDNDTKLIKTPWNFDLDGNDPPIDDRYINPNLNMIDMSVDYAENSMDLWPRRMCGDRACIGTSPPKGWTGGGWWGCDDGKGKANVAYGGNPRFPDLNKSSDGCSECDSTNGDKRSRWGWGNRVISYATGRSWSVNLRALPYNRDRNNASLFLRKAHCREANEWGLDEFLKTNNQYDGKAYCHRINNYDNVKIWVTGSMIDPCPPWPLQDWKSDLDIDIPLPPLNPNKPDSVIYTVTNELTPNGLTALNGSTGFMKIQPSAQYPSWVPVPAESNYAYKGVWKKIGTTWTWLQGLLRINNGKVDGTELRGISAINYTDMLNITNSVGISGAYQYIKGITLTERTWTEEKPKYNPTKNIFAQSIHFGWGGPDDYYGGENEIKLLYPRTACTKLSQYFGSCRSHNGCIQTTKAECKEFDRISRLDSGRGVTWTSQASCNGEPSITLINPDSGSIGGGEEITITGKDFHL